MSASRSSQLELLTLHGLSWLAAGNAVGLLLATLLLFPRLGDWLAPLSFGRWVPVHLNIQLYGWCGLALTGLLFRLYLPPRDTGPWPGIAVGVWSGTLVFGAISWLAGSSDGKIFLEWSGVARMLLAASLLLLELVLLVTFVRGLRAGGAPRRPWPIAVRAALLAALAPLPFVLYWAASPDVFPPINPDSGGATGGSLLGSTLVVVALVVACPLIVGLVPRGGRGQVAPVVALLCGHLLWFALLDHSNRSHHEWMQIASLASLVIWIPVLWRYLRAFDWPPASRRWIVAFCAWGAFLVVTGSLMFLPGVLERLKFTNALVAHAHLAMAGMATSFNVVVLVAINPQAGYTRLFADPRAFALWQGGCALFVLALAALGTLEAVSAGVMFGFDARVAALYALRWLAGAAMLWASLRWLASALRTWRPA